MKEIKLTNGMIALVDDADFEWLNKYTWSYDGKKYAKRTQSRTILKKDLTMHREIMGFPENKQVDHINGNKLDNRRENLRLCSNSENLCNRGKQKNNTSGYKGVTWNKNNKNWMAQINVLGKYIYIGSYPEKELAARAYDEAAKKYHGLFSKPNFSDNEL
jgi:hypothetical protein